MSLRWLVLLLAVAWSSSASAGTDDRKDVVQVDEHGVVYVLRDTDTAIQRWSIPEHRRLDPLPLGTEPLSFAYVQSHGLVYVQYRDGSIRSIDPSHPASEAAFASAPRPCGLVAAGDFLVACSISPLAFEFHLLSFDA